MATLGADFQELALGDDQIDFDVDIDEDFIFSEEIFEGDEDYNTVKVTEDDISEEALKDDIEIKLDRSPRIVFVDKEDPEIFVVVDDAFNTFTSSSSTSSLPATSYTCVKCSKVYKREAFYKKHQVLCKDKKGKLPCQPVAPVVWMFPFSGHYNNDCLCLLQIWKNVYASQTISLFITVASLQ